MAVAPEEEECVQVILSTVNVSRLTGRRVRILAQLGGLREPELQRLEIVHVGLRSALGTQRGEEVGADAASVGVADERAGLGAPWAVSGTRASGSAAEAGPATADRPGPANRRDNSAFRYT